MADLERAAMSIKKKISLSLIVSFALVIGTAWYLSTHINSTTSQPANNSSVETLRSLPYMTWAPVSETDKNKSGVTIHNPELAYKGINIYHSENIAGGHLMDMSGNVLHPFLNKQKNTTWWKLIEPYKDDDFLVLIGNIAMMRMDFNSNIKWATVRPFHHDIAVNDNGDIYSVINKKRNFPEYTKAEMIVDNCLVILSEDGELKKEISFAEMILKNPTLFNAVKNQRIREHTYGKDAWDVFHTNTIEIIDRDVFYKDERKFKKGDILFCMRHLNIIGVIDIEKQEITWSWGLGKLEYPHHPSLLENGNILIFDNGYWRKYSKVIELNPANKKKSHGNTPPTHRSHFSLHREAQHKDFPMEIRSSPNPIMDAFLKSQKKAKSCGNSTTPK